MAKETKEQLTELMTKKLAELKALEETQDFLRDNINEFMFKEKLYRVHRPVAWEKDQVNKERMKQYIDFLQDDKYLFRKQLIVLLLDKGVDVIAMEKDAQKMFNEEKELLKRLAQTTMEPDISTFKKQIEDIRLLQQENFIERDSLLKYCIETQLEDFCRFYLLYLVLEVKNGEEWQKVYKTYEDFQKSDDDLMLGRAAQVLAFIIYHDSL